MESVYVQAIAGAVALIAAIVSLVVAKFHFLNYSKLLKNSCIYIGRVKHTRLKGGNSTHTLDYPIFLTCVDLSEVANIGNILWPIFRVNSKKSRLVSFCSLDYDQHLVGWEDSNSLLIDRIKSFIDSKSNQAVKLSDSTRIRLMTHLTYFGYCFNPVSFYYFSNSANSTTSDSSSGEIDYMIAEVSNTPWIEQYSYLLHESLKHVDIKRKNTHSKQSAEAADGDADDDSNKISRPTFEASWNKEFHVSPFMEMDYRYTFTFTNPSADASVRVKMTRISTGETWFTASMHLTRLPFTPESLLYVLLFYPLHTRVIQLWIHIEAVKIWLKGVPTFEHPHGTDVNFGFGITGKRLGNAIFTIVQPFLICNNFIRSLFSSTK